jgi:hypothetical protein
MDFPHATDGSGLDYLDDSSVVVAGMDLSSHLSRQFGVGSRLGDEPRLLHVVCQRLFTIDVFSQPQRHDGRGSVDVVGSAHGDRVEPGLLQQLAKIIIFLGLRKVFSGLAEVVVVNIAKCHDVFRLHVLNREASLVGCADHADMQLLIRRAGLGRCAAAEIAVAC